MLKKRCLAAALSLCLVVSLLASCGQKNQNSGSGGGGASGGQGGSASSELNYPVKPVTIYCPWAAGGASDMLARAVASEFEKYTGQPATVVVKEGAGGTIAHGELAKEKADGYIIATTASGVFSSQPLLREVAYDIDDFEFIASATYEPFIFVALSDLGVNSVSDLQKKFEGKVLNVGTQAAGSLPDMAAKAVVPELGISEYNVVNYAGGAGELVPAVLGGHVDIGICQPSEVSTYLENGDVTIIGVTSAERIPEAPDALTFNEQGIACELANIKGFLMPAGGDPAVRDYLEDIMFQIFDSDEFKKFAQNTATNIVTMNGDEMKTFIEEQTVEFKELFSETA